MLGLARTTASLVAATIALGGALTGCGGSSPETSSGTPSDAAASSTPDAATQECRAAWRALGEDVAQARAAATGSTDPDTTAPPPSALTSRWTSVEATVAYYASSASAPDCEETLEQQRSSVEALSELVATLRPLDAERALADARADTALTSYERPRGRVGRRAPRPAEVTRALETLEEQAPTATTDQAVGWQEAAVLDLDDAEGRDQVVADLELLSEASRAWRSTQAAVAVLDRARAATR